MQKKDYNMSITSSNRLSFYFTLQRDASEQTENKFSSVKMSVGEIFLKVWITI